MPEDGQTLEPNRGNPQEELPFSKEPKLRPQEKAAIRERLACSQRFFEKTFQKDAERCRDLYRGYHWPKKNRRSKEEQRHWVVVNYLQHVVETIVGSITFHNPRVILQPESPQGLENQDRSQRSTNWGYRKAQAHRETRRAFKDAWVYGFGVVMTGWEFETATAPCYDGRPQVAGEPPSPDQVLDAVERGEAMESSYTAEPAQIVKDQAFCRRLDPRQFRIPTEADWVLENMPWVGYVEVKPLDEVKVDRRYRKGITRRLKGTAKSLRDYLPEEDRSKEEEELPSDVLRVKLQHYFEKRRRLHVIFADDEAEPILVEPWYWQHERYPFRLVFSPGLEDEFYRNPPPLMQWEHMQKEINLSRSQLAIHRARYNRKYLIQNDALTPAAKEALQSGEDGTGIELKPGVPASGAVVPLADAPLQAEVFASAQTAQSDLMALSMANQFEFGQAPTKRLTTTETQAIQGAGGARQKSAAQSYEELCAGVAEDIFDLMQQYAVRTQQLPIYNEQDQVVAFQPFTKDDIVGDYQFSVYVGSTEIKNQQGLIEQIGFLFQALAPYAQSGQINMKPLFEQLLSLMPEIKDVQAIVGPDQMAPGGMPPQPGLPPGMGGPEMEGGPPMDIPPELLQQLLGNGGAP